MTIAELQPRPGAFANYPSLKDRVVLVTGGGSGIGAAIVTAFAGQGAKVAFIDIDVEASEKLAANLAGAAHRPLFVRCDLTDVDALRAAIEHIRTEIGPISVLINNAANDSRQAIADVTSESWDRAMNANLKTSSSPRRPSIRICASLGLVRSSKHGCTVDRILPAMVVAILLFQRVADRLEVDLAQVEHPSRLWTSHTVRQGVMEMLVGLPLTTTLTTALTGHLDGCRIYDGPDSQRCAWETAKRAPSPGLSSRSRLNSSSSSAPSVAMGRPTPAIEPPT